MSGKPAIGYPTQCRQCVDPPCAKACPTQALAQGNGELGMRLDYCAGCGLGVEVCPYGARSPASLVSSAEAWLRQGRTQPRQFWPAPGGERY